MAPRLETHDAPMARRCGRQNTEREEKEDPPRIPLPTTRRIRSLTTPYAIIGADITQTDNLPSAGPRCPPGMYCLRHATTGALSNG